MSDCALPNGRWSGVKWNAPKDAPAPRRDGTDVLVIDSAFPDEDVACAREVVVNGYRFVRARRRDWDDCEVS